jgi:alpha-D-ribose 1-methylphosphonate 5-triphosphate synthase subunit PhnH
MDASGPRNQKNYRSLLQSLSRPGRVVRLEVLGGISPLAAAKAFAECLLDPEVAFCVMGNGSEEALQTAIVGATGARTVPLADADFVFFMGTGGQGSLSHTRRGSPEAPEEGATLVYCLESPPAEVSDRFRVRLTGPGIPEPSGIAPEMPGIPVQPFQDLMIVNADYPLGVDAFFVRPNGEVMGLPRSTRIRVR